MFTGSEAVFASPDDCSSCHIVYYRLGISVQASEIEMENKKFELLKVVTKPQRGPIATPYQRSSIKIALVSCECLDAGKPIDLGVFLIKYLKILNARANPTEVLFAMWSDGACEGCLRWWNKPVGSHVGNVVDELQGLQRVMLPRELQALGQGLGQRVGDDVEEEIKTGIPLQRKVGEKLSFLTVAFAQVAVPRTPPTTGSVVWNRQRSSAAARPRGGVKEVTAERSPAHKGGEETTDCLRFRGLGQQDRRRGGDSGRHHSFQSTPYLHNTAGARLSPQGNRPSPPPHLLPLVNLALQEANITPEQEQVDCLCYTKGPGMGGRPTSGDYVQNANLDLGVQNTGFTVSRIEVDLLPFGVISNHNQIAVEDWRRRTLIDKMLQSLLQGQQNLVHASKICFRAKKFDTGTSGHQGIQQGQNLANQRIESLRRVISARS
ncbi:tRNA N6-adenosine threonylcarbamoyltransferase [Striga asiatica]|uniref:tRNA N6-adenosine threonylcarbamoyltransferase n=1 Tax=Striga asiatica TaxID=4170 RepID=A0A5A7RFR6_STRAF|nr:tRNA N6-adenosine threonylcarbamoyltransferase [Striga asiatica]